MLRKVKVKPVGIVDCHQWDEASYDDEGNVVLPQGTIEWFVFSPIWDEDLECWVSGHSVLDGPFETEEAADQELEEMGLASRVLPFVRKPNNTN